jgi:hypothetical protein
MKLQYAVVQTTKVSMEMDDLKNKIISETQM